MNSSLGIDLWSVIQCVTVVCFYASLMQCENRSWLKTHLISLSHVAVQDPSHALDGRMLQFMGPSHIIINAPLWRGIQWVDEYVRNSQAKHKRTKILNPNCFVFHHTKVRWSNSYVWCGLQQHQGAQPNPVWTYEMTVYNCLTSTQPGTLLCQCQLI